ncbi:iron-siderophore ABC transporter substrate-binding protein [uncultured Amnibacterium sp.]|uniref:iron-siderophore ABC transporter substrate-binding protein n=1 Tax=uncultured Amnibacterium sp. TaxID=1631851 RepID=UPI0035CC06EF
MRASRPMSLVASAALLVALAGCAGSAGSAGAEGSGSSSAAGDAFPVTIEHAYGETTIESKPERVATVAWANQEVPLALGVVPVGMAKANYGDEDEDGLLPWTKERLDELGAKTPVLFDETDSIDFEAVADTKPDVILAAYSGLSKTDYETLSKIAPTIAFPKVAWGTTLEQMIEMNSTAMGLKAKGDALVASLDDQVAKGVADHPDLAGKTAMFAYFDPSDLSSVGFYTTHDTRPLFLEQLGMKTPKVVSDASAKSDEFYTTVSAEDADSFDDVDVIVTYGDAASLKTLQADPLIGKIPAIRDGSVALLTPDTALAAGANPSPLSLPWGLGKYLDLLDGAASTVG